MTAGMQRIVERMLELTALETRVTPGPGEEVALHEMAAEQAATLGAGVRWEVPGRATVEGERFLLGQAVLNLVQNAAEFSPAGGCIRISVTEEATGARVLVEDEGPGVPAYAVERVWGGFTRCRGRTAVERARGWGCRWCGRSRDCTGARRRWRIERRAERGRCCGWGGGERERG